MKYRDGKLKGRKRLFVHAIKDSAQGLVAAKRCARKIAVQVPSALQAFRGSNVKQAPRSQREETREYVPAIAGSRSQGQVRTLVANSDLPEPNPFRKLGYCGEGIDVDKSSSLLHISFGSWGTSNPCTKSSKSLLRPTV